MIYNTQPQKETAILIGVVLKNQDEKKIKEYLEELEFLMYTAGGETKNWFIQKLEKPNPKTYIGAGKLAEIKHYVESNKIDIAVFDDELSPAQLRNVEKELECKVLDRTNIILDIFAKRARTSYARTQVELAQYQYLLPRLTRMWLHLSKQRGGIGLKGPGEKEIETDRRIIKDRIALLKNKLLLIDKQKATQRSNRKDMVRISLVGYTNVGKSTLMNLLSKSSVFAENKLFATLDTTVRKVIINNLPFLLSDTVGFIRKLPHTLIESFKSTLDEIKEADIIMHVIDISHPAFEEQIKIVNSTLKEINIQDKPIIMVFNKIDAYFINENINFNKDIKNLNTKLENLKHTWMAKEQNKTVFISATQNINIDELKNMIYEMIKDIYVKRYPYNHFLF